MTTHKALKKPIVAAMAMAGLFSVLSSSPAQAALIGDGCTSYLLSSIKANNCKLQVGDKLFSDFTPSLTSEIDGSTDGGTTPFSLAGLELVEVNDPLEGIGFEIRGALSASYRSYVDLGLSYIVEVLDPKMRLTGISTALTGSTGGKGEINISERLDPLSPLSVVDPLIIDAGIGISGKDIQASTSFAGLVKARITKDILVRAVSTENDFAEVSVIRNLHQQTAVSMPTPALLPGLLGFGATILRKRKKVTAAA